MKKIVHSKICRGWVGHRRFSPTNNAFRYRVFMMYVDLDELNDLLQLTWSWSSKFWRPAQFKRQDFWGDANKPLKQAVLDSVNAQLGLKLDGPVRMLTNFRYFGYITNPLTTYYCFEKDGKTLRAILANVNNTPWGEHHGYALSVPAEGAEVEFSCDFEKNFHVSPFNPLNMTYHWVSTLPGSTIDIHLENWREGHKVMDASLNLATEVITRKKLQKALIQYPFMTVKVVGLIYWQAFKLWCKRNPIYDHPNRTVSE